MKNMIFLTLLVAGTHLLYAQTPEKKADALVSPRLAEKELTVGGNDADICGFNNQSIQYAIDAVAKTGGTVKLNPGLYEITAPVRMKSNVKLIGSGKETVLKRGKGIQTPSKITAQKTAVTDFPSTRLPAIWC